MMDSELPTLTREELASLLSVSDTCPASIPFEHEFRLTRLGYVADINGRLSATRSGSARIAAAGFENRPRLDSKLGHLGFLRVLPGSFCGLWRAIFFMALRQDLLAAFIEATASSRGLTRDRRRTPDGASPL